MNYVTIADAYAANDKIRERLRGVLGNTDDAGAASPVEGSNWSIQQIVEHIAIVNEGTAKICSKLVGEAKKEGKPGDGLLNLSADFGEKGEQIAAMKVEAPERVQPTGKVSINEALTRSDAATQSVKALKTDLETYDVSGHTFPHPFFGDITAAEWLVLGGLHELRHTKQIERLLAV